jgi:WD40 repeat protein
LAFWEVESGKRLNLLPEAGAGSTEWAAAATIDFSNDGRLVAIGHRDGWVRLWDWKQQRLLGQFQAHHNNYFGGAEVRFSGDSRWLVSIMGARSGLALFDLTNVKNMAPVLAPIDPATMWSATFTPDNKTLIIGDNDGLKFLNLQTLRVSMTLRHNYDPGVHLAMAPDGNLLASKAAGLVKFWMAPALQESNEHGSGH